MLMKITFWVANTDRKPTEEIMSTICWIKHTV